MVWTITIALASALLSCLSVTALAANLACKEFAGTKRLYGPSEYRQFVSACGVARTFKGNRNEVAKRWADCVNRRVDSEKPDSSDDWLKIMEACLVADGH